MRRTDEAGGEVRKWVGASIRIALGVAAAWAVMRELRDVDPGTLRLEIASVSIARYALGIGCTVGSFLLLGVIEWMALRNCDGDRARRVPLSSAMRTGFVANALSQSVGFAVLTGAAVRTRAYARHGLDAVGNAQATAFVTITATLGLLAAGAVAVLADGGGVTIGVLSFAARPTAFVLGGIVVAYVLWGVLGRGDGLGWRQWRVPRPTPRLAVGQVLLSALDWLITGGVLYAFMPPHVGLRLGIVLGAYLVAQVVAVTSHVPAGAGVFELVVVAILVRVDPGAPRAALAAALVMFRVVYYVVPLCVAVVMAALTEWLRHRTQRSPFHDRGIVPTGVLENAR